MTKANKTAPTTSKLATADNSAITVQATELAPIAADASAKWESFTARPGVAATGSAFKKAGSGAKWLWAQEKEYGNVRKFLIFLKDAFNAVVLPLLSLVWLALNHVYQWSRKPETKASVIACYQLAKTWAAPKYDYETEADRNSAIEL